MEKVPDLLNMGKNKYKISPEIWGLSRNLQKGHEPV